MIEVKNLSKIYIDKEVETKALKNVSFSLPDSGLIFVVGKSGSGKSTLINMIGGLDDISEGHVIVDGFDLASKKTHELDKFRNTYLGIVYQNYNLFNEDTVFSNVRSAVDVIQKKVSADEINNIIDLVELSDKKDSLVKNLSGGQKQRVAVARALIKNPKLILADEPTGNLDSKTAKTIFEFFKKESKNRLVVIITHDMPSALEYADRILEIADGQIIKDVVRNKFIQEGYKHITLSENQVISKDEINQLNKELEKINYHASLKEDRFEQNKGNEIKQKSNYVAEKQKYRHVLSNSIKILKRNKISTAITTTICMAMVGLMSISFSLTKFDSRAAIDDVIDLYDVKNLVIRKTYSKTNQLSNLQKTDLLKITDSEEAMLEQKGYVGNKYPIYTVDSVVERVSYSIRNTNQIKYENMYAECFNGVVVCDKPYLEKLFGTLDVVAGSLYSVENNARVLIPDFVADSYLYFNNDLKSPDPNDPYQNIVNAPIFGRTSIGAVIKTNYKQKYYIFLETINRIKKEPQHASQLRKELVKSELYAEFLSDANSYLNYGYSLNPDYINFVHENYSHTFLTKSFISFTENGAMERLDVEDQKPILSRYEGLENDEAEMSLPVYNKMFGKALANVEDPEFEEKEVYITKYSSETEGIDNKLQTIKLRIIRVYEPLYPDDYFHVSSELRKGIIGWDIYKYGWAFDNVEQCYDLYQKTYPYYFYNYVTCFQAVYDTINIIAIFSEIFNIVLIALMGILILIISMHNLRIIKRETYRFGVLKSMGYSSLYLALTLLIMDIISMVGIFGLSTLFSYLAGLGSNKLIQLGFVRFAKSTVYLHITMISFNFSIVLLFNGLVLLLMAATSFIPFLAIKHIKPSKIIRNSE